jgi:diguanylate cyclase (GGDEF)-like protein
VRIGASVGVLSPFVGGDYYGSIIAGANGAAVSAGGRVIAIQTLQPGSKSADDTGVPDFRMPVAWDHLDGFLVLPGAVAGAYVAALQGAGKPVALIGHRIPDTECPVVLTDNRSGIAQAVAHLVAHGHERIAFSGHLSGTDVRERYDAYCEAMRTHDLRVDPELLFLSSDNHESGGIDVGQRMHAAGMPATALLLGTDRNAIGLLEGLKAAGYQLPRDLAVVGFDDIALACYTEPSLSSVRQSLDALGETGHEIVSDMLDGGSAAPKVSRVPTQYIPRDSCGCPHTGLRVSEPQMRRQFADNQNLHLTLNTQYDLAIELLRTHEQDPRAVTWLDRTSATGGCLGLWRGDPTGLGQSPDAFRDQSPDAFCDSAGTGRSPADLSADGIVDVVGVYPQDLPAAEVGAELPVRAFPPAGLLSLPRAGQDEIVFIVPVSGDKRDWGVLAAVGRVQDSTPPGREMMNHSGALLAVALEHDLMLRSLHEQEERLRQTALHDQLTGLPNRTLLLDRLTQAGQRATRHEKQPYAVLFIDLDGFKVVNDTYGHAAGDAVLVEVARRLTKVVRSADTAARLGGDEFVLLLEDLSGEGVPQTVVERVERALEAPMTVAGQTMRMRGSIGVAISDAGGTEPDSLLRIADQAMYLQKEMHGRSRSGRH